jgi:hypothetical protein
VTAQRPPANGHQLTGCRRPNKSSTPACGVNAGVARAAPSETAGDQDPDRHADDDQHDHYQQYQNQRASKKAMTTAGSKCNLLGLARYQIQGRAHERRVPQSALLTLCVEPPGPRPSKGPKAFYGLAVTATKRSGTLP